MKILKELFYAQAKWLSSKLGFASDKIMHFEGGGIIDTGVFYITLLLMQVFWTPNIFLASAIALIAATLAGLSKEIRDAIKPNGSGFDIKDFYATVLGGLTSRILNLLFICLIF
jgi:hypothetical protein